jgi:hypothetical protein
MLSDPRPSFVLPRVLDKPGFRFVVTREMSGTAVQDLRDRVGRRRRRRRSSDSLQRELGELVKRRQELRARGASDSRLERNRRKIVRLQHRLRHALIAKHLESVDRRAA